MVRRRTRSSGDAGPVAAAAAARARRSRALEEPLDVSWIATEPYLIALVRNPLHGTRYRVYAPDVEHLDDGLCTCPDFALRGPAKCKHLEAIQLWLTAHPPPVAPAPPAVADPRGIWSRVESGRRQPPKTLSELRREGRALIETAG